MGGRMAHGNTLPSGIIVSPKKGEKKSTPNRGEKKYTQKKVASVNYPLPEASPSSIRKDDEDLCNHPTPRLVAGNPLI